jgi:hypothetical protein
MGGNMDQEWKKGSAELLILSLLPKFGVKFTVAVQICPKIGLLLSQFMQQSMNFD